MFKIVYLFPFFFAGMWVLVSFILSKTGWNNLAQKFRTNDAFHGTRIGIISASINSASYNNSLVLRYNYDGIYLRPVLFFRSFHPPIFVPWSEIKYVRDKKIFLTRLKELVIGDPCIAMITIKASAFNKLEIPVTIPGSGEGNPV